MDDHTGSLTAPRPAAAPAPHVAPARDPLLRSRLEALRTGLTADTVALVAWDRSALRVVSRAGADITGSAAMLVGVACARAEHLAPGSVVDGPGGVHVVVRPPADPRSAETTAVVVVSTRVVAPLTSAAVADLWEAAPTAA